MHDEQNREPRRATGDGQGDAPAPGRRAAAGERSGEYLLRVLRPGGAVAVLLLGVLFLVTCFTHRSDPVLDYVPAHTAAYYTAHPEALEQELRANLLRYLPPCEVRAGKAQVEVRAAPDALEHLRLRLGGLFGEHLFVFTELDSIDS